MIQVSRALAHSNIAERVVLALLLLDDTSPIQLTIYRILAANLNVHQYTGSVVQQFEMALRWLLVDPNSSTFRPLDNNMVKRIRAGKRELNNNAYSEFLYDYDMMRDIMIYVVRFRRIALSPKFKYRDWYHWIYQCPSAGVSLFNGCLYSPLLTLVAKLFLARMLQCFQAMQQIFALEDGAWENELLTDEILEIFETTFTIHFRNARSLNMNAPDFLIDVSSYWIDLIDNMKEHIKTLEVSTPQQRHQWEVIIKNLEARQAFQQLHRERSAFMFCWSLPGLLHESLEVTIPVLKYVSHVVPLLATLLIVLFITYITYIDGPSC